MLPVREKKAVKKNHSNRGPPEGGVSPVCCLSRKKKTLGKFAHVLLAPKQRILGNFANVLPVRGGKSFGQRGVRGRRLAPVVPVPTTRITPTSTGNARPQKSLEHHHVGVQMQNWQKLTELVQKRPLDPVLRCFGRQLLCPPFFFLCCIHLIRLISHNTARIAC